MRARQSWLVVGALGSALALVAAAVSAGDLFTITDPKGDDWGTGSLVYPLREDMVPGDLDMLAMSARAESEGTVFEVTFARQIRQPWRRTIDDIGTSLDQVAKLGFYTFNLDIYIDTDRLPGSGSTVTLPGRRASIDRKTSWEKAICLTPRPLEAKEALQATFEREARRQVKQQEGRVDATAKEEIKEEAKGELADSVFFPTLVWVKGSKISFFVPASFLGAQASASWAYVVAVSGSDIRQKFDLPKLMGKDLSVPDLMIIPIVPGKSKDSFGGAPDDDDMIPPLVDIFVPKTMVQEAVLKDYDLRTARPVALPGVVPAEQ